MCTLVEIYFVILILIFSILTTQKKQISLPEEVKRIFNCSERVLLSSNKTNISFIYKKLLLTLRKIICLVKEFFLVNSFIGVFWYFSIILAICYCHLVICCLTKPLWNCLPARQIFSSGRCRMSVSLSV